MNDKCKHCENKHNNFTNYEGHEVSEQNHLNQNKGIDESDKAIVSEMLNVQANNQNIADVLSKKTGKIFNSQDIRNIVSRLNDESYDYRGNSDVNLLINIL